MKAFRASIFDFVDDPSSGESAWRYFDDGLLVTEQGRVTDCGDYARLKPGLDTDCELVDYSGHLIMPGFIDTHVHYVQTDMIASQGAQLLDWLERYTYPTERRFEDAEVARGTAQFFVDELLRNGTTSAMVFASVHPQSVDALFEVAAHHGLCMIAGKVMMDRNAPGYLRDSAQSSYEDSARLIQRWHHHQRLHYAVTPRFALTSSEQQLRVAQQLLNEYPDVYLQSHVAENRGEVDQVARDFPWSRSYLDVYDHFGLLGPRSLYAHCIHLDATDFLSLAKTGTAVAFCPTSNLFLGSGLFDMGAALEHGFALGLGTDVGAGTSFSLLRTLNEAYKVCQLRGYKLSPLEAFYRATLGAARALYLEPELGNFEAGKAADFVVIDLQSTALIERRMQFASSIEQRLFVLMMLGDDRSVVATHVQARCVYQRQC
jgi:guanine deaminase